MASEVEICNLALAHIGDSATVASINPPEGSAQAEHCARFYPIARDMLLEAHDWNFATKRISPAQLTSGTSAWLYAYAMPADALKITSVLPPSLSDDYVSSIQSNVFDAPVAEYAPQPFCIELDENNNLVIYTDQATPIIRYRARVNDTTRFSPLFTMALSYQLASMLAGPVIKGDVGAVEAKRCAQLALTLLANAKASDSSQRNIKVQHNVDWVIGR